MDAADQNQSVKLNMALGEFLRSRRARLGPDEAGVLPGRRRRVQGLRRDELASLANISVDYYTRLEQGRHGSASPGVLDAIAAALRLSVAERIYLHRLAAPRTGASTVVDRVRPETVRLLRVLDPNPAVVIGPGMDVLAANAGHRRLYADFEALPSRNALHWMLFDPRARDLYGADWAETTAEMIGMLRLRSDEGARDARAREVIDDLAAASSFFREVWHRKVVSTGVQRVRRFMHPEAGPVEMSVENLQVVHADGQTLIVHVPAPGSRDERVWHSVMARPAPAAA